LRIGGPARLLAVADTLHDLSLVLEVCAEEGAAWSIIGKGSNLLVSDEGFDGVMVQLGQDFRRIRRDGDRLQAGAGVALPVLVQMALKDGLSGLAFAVGIPGTVGGGIVGNAGAHGSAVGDLIHSVTLYGPYGRLRDCNRSELRFGYRSSSLGTDDVIVEGLFQLTPGDPAQIRGEMERYFKQRKQTQPTGLPSAGSVFKNAGERPAGKLIDEAGLKGARVGGACVSERHANFIVNAGDATAADVFALIGIVQQRVRDVHAIDLEPEIRLVGRFETDRSEVGTAFTGCSCQAAARTEEDAGSPHQVAARLSVHRRRGLSRGDSLLRLRLLDLRDQAD